MIIANVMPPWHIAPNGTGTSRAPASGIVEGPTLEDLAELGALREGWRRVRANRGGPGLDDVTVEHFETALDGHLSALRATVLDGSYRPSRLKRIPMRKVDGGVRWLGIPSVADRVLQSSALVVLGPGIDRHMSDSSWAYRSGRSVAQALDQLKALIQSGHNWIVDADLERYFDSVPHDGLMSELAIWIDDERILKLFCRWLSVFGRKGRGIAQGAPISPLLANIYLHPLDRLLRVRGFQIIRYADDFVVSARSESGAHKAIAQIRELLRRRGLRLNAQKTRIVAPGESFIFLGQEFATAAASSEVA